MLNTRIFALAELVRVPGIPPPRGAGWGGRVGVGPHSPKNFFYFLRVPFFAVFAAALKAFCVGAPFAPGSRIFSGVLPAAFCALIRRLLAAILEYRPLFPGITFSSIWCPHISSAFAKGAAGYWGSWRLWGASSSGQLSDCSRRRLFW